MNHFQRYSLAFPIAVALSLLGLVLPYNASHGNELPNFIIIMADDQGYQDIGCYGSPLIKTPYLDQMAKEGVRFTSFYSANSVCSPSRAALLTGCYPTRVSIPAVLFPRDRIGLNPDETTIADLLKKQGYATACIGKWHLGHHPEFLPTRHGFDEYYGIPYSNDMRIDKSSKLADDVVLREGYTLERIQKEDPKANFVPLMRNEEIIEYPADQTTLTKRYTEESIRFITENKDKPFFLYLPHTMPHIPLFASDEFRDKSERGRYGDTIEELDHSTGMIIEKLKELGIDDKTLVVYTSDNGPWKLKEGKGGHADPLRGFKFSTYEGGMRVPCIMRWPNKIPAGTTCTQIAASIDLLPTLAGLAGAKLPDETIDGVDITKLLESPEENESPRDTYFFYKGNNLQAVRKGHWKLRRTKEQVELFDLNADLSETTNLVEENTSKVSELKGLIDEFDAKLKKEARPAGQLDDAPGDETQKKQNEKQPTENPLSGSRKEVYKKIGDVELAIHIFEPKKKATDKKGRPAAVFFFGGGWNSGSVNQFAPHCRYLASRGMVAMVADYRVARRHKTTPFECVQDGKSAIRWIRANAKRLGIDPNRIAAGGGSAGGHVAAATETTVLDEPGEDTTVSSRPNALLLFNPVYDNGPDGYGYKRVANRYLEISPMHNIQKGMAPAIVFLGTNDGLIPVETAKQFQQKMLDVGSQSELHLYDGQPHGFFNHRSFRKNASSIYYDKTVYAMDQFLASVGFLSGKPTITLPGFKFQNNKDDTSDILFDGKLIARYMHGFDTSTKETTHATYKPFLHVFDENAKGFITKGPGGLYTHHRGIFIGFSKLEKDGKKYDTWHMKNCAQVHKSFSNVSEDAESATFTSHVDWQDNQGNLLLVEQRQFKFLTPPDKAYVLIEQTSSLEAVNGDVKLAGDPEHAGVQFRPANEIVKEETQFVFHETDVDPKKNKDLPWVGQTFQIPSGKYSVVMLNHPANPKGTVWSAYRDYGRFGAYPTFEIPDGETRALRYRFIIGSGPMISTDTIEQSLAEFSE